MFNLVLDLVHFLKVLNLVVSWCGKPKRVY